MGAAGVAAPLQRSACLRVKGCRLRSCHPRGRRGGCVPARKRWRWASRSAGGCPHPVRWPAHAQPEPPEGASGRLLVSARQPLPGRRAPSLPPPTVHMTSRGSRGWRKSQWGVARARSRRGMTKGCPEGRGARRRNISGWLVANQGCSLPAPVSEVDGRPAPRPQQQWI